MCGDGSGSGHVPAVASDTRDPVTALLPDIASEQAAEPGLALTCVQVFDRNGLRP